MALEELTPAERGLTRIEKWCIVLKFLLPFDKKRLIFIKPLSPHCLTRAAGTVGGRPARRVAAATQLATAAPSANTKTGRSTITSVVKACRGCREAAVSLWAPPPPPPPPQHHPARLPLTRRALLQDRCPWWGRVASQQGLAAAVEVFLPAPRRAVPAVPLAPQLQLPPPYWMPPPADPCPSPSLLHTVASVPTLHTKPN